MMFTVMSFPLLVAVITVAIIAMTPWLHRLIRLYVLLPIDGHRGHVYGIEHGYDEIEIGQMPAALARLSADAAGGLAPLGFAASAHLRRKSLGEIQGYQSIWINRQLADSAVVVGVEVPYKRGP